MSPFPVISRTVLRCDYIITALKQFSDTLLLKTLNKNFYQYRDINKSKPELKIKWKLKTILCSCSLGPILSPLI